MVGNNKLGRATDHRMADLRNLVTALIEHGRIETTEARAVEAQKLAEKFITLAVNHEGEFTVGKKKVSRAKLDANGNKVTEKKTSKNGRTYNAVVRETVEVEARIDSPARLHARRQILSFLYNVKDENGKSKKVVNKLFDEIAPKYKERKGGYTRIIKVGPRRGDGAEVAIIELV